MCHAAGQLKLACDEQHLTRLSEVAGIVNSHRGYN